MTPRYLDAADAVGRHRDVTRLNYDYDQAEHGRWTAAAKRKGQTLREWVRRSLNKAADEEATAAEAERKRRSR